jgi:hypothetical protein
VEKEVNFIKKHRFDIIVTSSVVAFFCDVFFNIHSFSLTIIGLYILGYAADNERSQNNIAERKRLMLKGLTKQDLNNIEFVKDWGETRKKGLINYSLIYGGIFFGFVLCAVISILTMVIKQDMINYIAAAPSHMFNFIGYTYVGGLVGGTIIYRFLWKYKEEKFIRLTDPVH